MRGELLEKEANSTIHHCNIGAGLKYELAIEFCSIIPFTNKIKARAILIKRQIKIPLPDAIIGATAIEEGLTLVTADKGFRRIKELQLILIEV